MICHPDPPDAEGLTVTWRPTAQPGAWFLPTDLDFSNAALEHWLFALGNWTVCSHALPLESIPAFFRAPVVDSLSWLDARKLDVIIDSFHDDTSWVIGLGDVDTTAK
jgi:hypothetical protein